MNDLHLGGGALGRRIRGQCIGRKGVWEVQEKCQRKDVEVLSWGWWEVGLNWFDPYICRGVIEIKKRRVLSIIIFSTCSHTGRGTRMWQEVGHWRDIDF